MTQQRLLPAAIETAAGDRYIPTLFRIESRDEKGRPESLVLLPGDRQIEIVGGEEFLIAYVLAQTLMGE